MRIHKTVQQNRVPGIDAGISAFMLLQRASRQSECKIKHYSNSLMHTVHSEQIKVAHLTDFFLRMVATAPTNLKLSKFPTLEYIVQATPSGIRVVCQ